MNNKHIVVLANGEFPSVPEALNYLNQAELIICCDGAAEKLWKAGYQSHLIIGDCDSLSSENIEKYQSEIIIDKDQNYNDLQKALRYCIKQKFKKVFVLGATGLRDDHTLANISIIMMYAVYLDLVMISNYGIFTPISKTTKFPSFPGQQVSVFSFEKERIITFHNLLYPVKKHIFHHLWEGSLNQSLSDHFTVECDGTGVVVFSAFRQES